MDEENSGLVANTGRNDPNSIFGTLRDLGGAAFDIYKSTQGNLVPERAPAAPAPAPAASWTKFPLAGGVVVLLIVAGLFLRRR